VYSGKTEDGVEYTFGTSGLLYRSNKLMYDRQTFTLWANLTGEPVVGKMATSDQRLRVLPMTLTTWSEWRKMHPQTKVLFVEDKFGAQWNYRYEPGLADRARAGVNFPVWQKSKVLENKAEVYALRVNNIPKAYPIKQLIAKRIVNDKIGETPVVLLVDPESQAVRAYKREGHTFSADLKDETGKKWVVTEEALVSGEQKLTRIPGHLSLWFAWYGFFPHTEIYR
jgi:Protein of unknown function (DUF3179)